MLTRKEEQAVELAGIPREEAAKIMGVGERRYRAILDSARKKGASVLRQAENAHTGRDEIGSIYYAPDGYNIKGTSTLVDGDGTIKQQWIKTDADKERQIEMMQEVIDAMSKSIKPRKVIKQENKSWNPDLLDLFTLTDFHVGMLAWDKETGDNWDIKIAKDVATKAFAHLIKAAPNSETAVLLENGDFGHFDSFEAVTPTNKHLLDADGRAPKMIEACIDIMLDAIEQLAQKYKRVIVICNEGNHNPIGSVWMSALLDRYYSKNKRIEVVTSPKPYHAIEWGVNMLAFHHGHLAKAQRLIDVFISEYREMYGRTQLLHIHTGHVHHRAIKETSTAILETHPTLAGRDAYAARGGWNSDRAMQVITYHKKFREVSRNLVHADML